MEPLNKNILRHQVIENYAQWCAFSATRSGCPLKSRADVYPLIQLPKYDQILIGDKEIDEAEFDSWHKESCIAISNEREICIGWAAKLINVYLKTISYTGMIGRPGLISCLHPPIDNGLIQGIRNKYRGQNEILQSLKNFSTIKEIKEYADYIKLIRACKAICRKEGWILMEIETLWEGTMIKSVKKMLENN